MPKKKPASTLQLVVIRKGQLDQTYEKHKKFRFAPKCHPNAATLVKLNPSRHLEMKCAECNAYLLEFAIIAGADFQLTPCEEHPDKPVYVSYSRNKLLISCTCKKTLQKLTVAR